LAGDEESIVTRFFHGLPDRVMPSLHLLNGNSFFHRRHPHLQHPPSSWFFNYLNHYDLNIFSSALSGENAGASISATIIDLFQGVILGVILKGDQAPFILTSSD
jgi:hypothetical protein